MSSEIKLPSKITNKVLDKLLENLYNNSFSSIKLPKKISNLKFGMQPILLQIISLLFIQNSDLKATISEMKEDDLSNFSEKLIYLSVILRASDFVDKEDKSFRKSYMLKATEFLKNMHDISLVEKTYKGIGTQYICFDWSNHYSYINTLYNNKKLISRELFLKNFSKKIFHNSINKSMSYDDMRDKIEGDFGYILYELFQNTEDHARNDSITKKSIRGFTTNLMQVPEHEIIKNYDYLKNYLYKLNEFKTSENLQFIEMAVFDTGNGLAKSISKKDVFLSFKEEKDFVLNCFNKHSTSKQSKIYGLGLYDVVKKVKENYGLFLLRTGRLNIIVNYEQISIDNEKILFNIEIKESKNIIGTSFSIILPLNCKGVI